MSSPTKKEKTRTFFRPISSITVSHIRQMYDLYAQYYENTSLDIFLSDLSKKSGVILVERKSDDRLVGFSTQTFFGLNVEGKRVRGVFSGDFGGDDVRLKSEVASPHIAFFEKVNPTWRHGTDGPCRAARDDESPFRSLVDVPWKWIRTHLLGTHQIDAQRPCSQHWLNFDEDALERSRAF